MTQFFLIKLSMTSKLNEGYVRPTFMAHSFMNQF